LSVKIKPSPAKMQIPASLVDVLFPTASGRSIGLQLSLLTRKKGTAGIASRPGTGTNDNGSD
jgi:hypothetical protein